MSTPDFNLLLTLDVLLAEGHVARAAQRLHLSPSAMSRALARLRQTTGDPLLVRAGRGLVPTPRALELREHVARLVEDANAVLRPAEHLDLARLERTFTLRSREGFVETVGAALIARVRREAPGVRLVFALKPDKDNTALRDGTADLETAIVGTRTGPEMRAQALFTDRYVGVVRAGHPLATGDVTPERFAAADHLLVSRRGEGRSAVDEALAAIGLERRLVAFVGSFSAALALVRASDLVVCVPERATGILRDGLHSFALPLPLPEFSVSMVWHPRMHADPAHRWLRTCVRELFLETP